ncbi:unnamed protein product [Urochloa decumbens]|uniref:F-box domain-containing protein n=1 Tax=Urochloa decumbens TaxID=240449 RepID=A0ABC9GD49_9POAL
MAPPPPELFDVLVEEVFLRFPPEDPASLLRAALVCKRWHRLVSGRHFRRRFRGFHRTPPMLGAIVNNHGFVSTSSFRCQVPAELLRGCMVLDARHGRVLFHSVSWASQPRDPTLYLWNPISGEKLELPKLPLVLDPHRGSSNFAVLCAAAGCNHLDCSHGPFLVVAVVVSRSETFARVYSSEHGEWSDPTFAPHINDSLVKVVEGFGEIIDSLDLMPGVLVGDAVYFLLHTMDAVLQFNLTTREMAIIHLPDTIYSRPIALLATEDGNLGFAGTKERTLHLWSRVAGPGEETWSQSRVIELEKLLPVNAIKRTPIMLGSVGVIFLYTCDGGIYSVDLKSSKAREMPDRIGVPDYVVPFMSFCTPALGAAPTDEEPSGSTSSA